MNDLRSLRTKLKEDLRTSTGRNFLTFLVFLAISTIFWFVMALNDEVQKDFKLPLVLEDFPQDMTIVSGQVATVNVTIKEKGSSLAKFSWGSSPQLKVRYGDFTRPSDDNLLLSEAQLNSAVRGIFGSSATVVAIRPDSIHLTYTTNPGVPVRVMVDADSSTAAACSSTLVTRKAGSRARSNSPSRPVPAPRSHKRSPLRSCGKLPSRKESVPG